MKRNSIGNHMVVRRMVWSTTFSNIFTDLHCYLDRKVNSWWLILCFECSIAYASVILHRRTSERRNGRKDDLTGPNPENGRSLAKTDENNPSLRHVHMWASEGPKMWPQLWSLRQTQFHLQQKNEMKIVKLGDIQPGTKSCDKGYF
jgi:hypothetical protein